MLARVTRRQAISRLHPLDGRMTSKKMILGAEPLLTLGEFTFPFKKDHKKARGMIIHITDSIIPSIGKEGALARFRFS